MNSEINPMRFVPSFMNGHSDYMLTANCEVFFTVAPYNGKYVAIAYTGKSKVKSWFYNFKTEEAMNSYIAAFLVNRRAIEADKIANKAAKKLADANVKCEVGSLFYTSGGYDQTNVSFYMVTEFKSHTATVVEIGSKQVIGSEGFMSCDVVPDKSRIISDSFKKRIICSYNGLPSFKQDYGYAHLTDEATSHYCSWYA